MSDEPQADRYWYNTKTQQVEKGPQSSWENRMGPYDTEEEARRALDTAAAKAASWDAEDEKWRNG